MKTGERAGLVIDRNWDLLRVLALLGCQHSSNLIGGSILFSSPFS